MYEAGNSRRVLSKRNIDSVIGEAAFVTNREIDVLSDDGQSSTRLRARKGIVIATGAGPRRLDGKVDGLDTVLYMTYEDIFRLNEVPKSLTVVGGGAIGCELSQAFARFGSKVSLISERLLPNNEPEMGKLLEEVFENENEGITIVRGKLSSVKKSDGLGHIASCTFADGTVQHVLGDHLLMAVGRQPFTNIRGLDDLGIKIGNRGGFDVNGRLETSVKGVYAAGDCLAYKQFSHFAGFQGAIAARNILLPSASSGDIMIPACAFTSPEVASIGMSEAEAIAKYGADKVAVSIQHARYIDRSICENEDVGFIKIIYRKEGQSKKSRNRILGAGIVLDNAGEVINEIAIAMKAGLPFDALENVMHSYPTRSFALQNMAGTAYYDKLAKLKKSCAVLKRAGF